MYPDDPFARSASVTSVVALGRDESGAYIAAGANSAADAVPRAEEERRWIARCVQGETEAFRPLVVRYQRLAFSVSLRMLGSRPDAEDVVQQAMVDAFNALERFRNEGLANAFSTWLLRIVVNRSKDVLKSKRWTERSVDGDVAEGEAAFAAGTADPEANLTGQRRRRRLEEAVLSLPTKYREVIILKDIEELSYEEMRSILHLPITTLKMRVVRGRTLMRERIGDLEEPR